MHDRHTPDRLTHDGATPDDAHDGSTLDDASDARVDRRAFLAGTAALGSGALAGCFGVLDDGDDSEPFDWIGSGPGQRQAVNGTPMAELPDLEGELTLYAGRSQFLVNTLLDDINGRYDDFEAVPRYGGSNEMANQIVVESEGTSADVFFSSTGGALGTLASEGRTRALSDDVLSMVPEAFRTDTWIGTGGRIRTVPYNTTAFSESELPEDVAAYADLDADMGWAPTYGACKEFLTAMRVLEGEEATREWIQGVLDAGITAYADEQLVCEAVANGEIDLGFTNHYYIQRVQASRDDPPLATAFTEGDAGATFNVAGAAVIDQTDAPELAENFVRHLLSAEAQVFFALRTYEYPLAPEVEPVGGLPAIGELDVPDVDLSELSNVEATVELMRDVGVQI